ncbi:carboxypeptidase-like regulatory domain-containing protein [Flavobacterium humidisoli]|uniref:Carboxypeptidase-like regulatory domain-containing protein n=1 Tax=Flavobacterium humidisoli TaxID=2937442 RepID=A0ABY4LST0_9FLAO|nr:carboxypeptidase-like regulatory domain-containing protein [Flavobacterium humidisoli]UPZ16140.1 carboxypeptidase-like regulatory domain-containing protein [Flavobacterium humidisoli]
MKNILFVFLLVSTTLLGQQNDKKWNNVIALENEGKIKSANEIVAKIYRKTINQKDEVEMIRCFFYESKYLQVFDQNAQTKILNNLKTDINRVSIPSKAILNLVYAKCLTDYYTINRYQIDRRTNTTISDNDFLTWTENNFTSQINLALKNALENEAVLKTTPLTKYEAIFDYPTIEKFKTLNLLDYVISENITIQSQKIRSWEIKKDDFFAFKKDLLGNSNDFLKLNFDSVSNENLKVILKLYQKQEINNPSADNIWQRIQFSKNYIVDIDADYVKTLTALQKQTNDISLIQNIQLEKAYYLSKHASKYNYPDYNIKAIATLDSILKTENKSNAYKLALKKKEDILRKFINVQLQKFVYNNENMRGLIQYQNIENLKISFFKINQAQINLVKDYPKDTIIENIVKKIKPTTSQTYTLINKKDYYEYSTEVLLPKLETGSYLVYFESNSDVKGKKATAFETITVSQFIVLCSKNEKFENYQVLDRKTGKPLENVIVKTPFFSVKTNKNGNAELDKVKEGQNKLISFYTANDTLSLDKNYIYYNAEYLDNENPKISATVQFYLDRAIYRPGQTVYYKGIAVQRLKGKVSVVPYTSFKITVEDSNRNDFKEFDVTTNEFGSFSGEFILPKTGLTGTFTIKADEPDEYEKDKAYDKTKEKHPFWDNVNLSYSDLLFKVEEYKRPKFEVNFEPKKESFELNKLVKVNGTAKAFAGSTISDSKVTYSVIRSINYFRNYYSQESIKVLKTGETKTDASGKFTIDFTALPSENAIKEKLPVFSYLIKVSVTDINGETHDAQTTINVGYHDLELSTAVKDVLLTKNKNDIKLSSTNLNGESKSVKGEIKIYFLNPISKKFKTRVFSEPDIEGFSDKEFEKLFPYESNVKLKDKTPETLVFSKEINTQTDKELPLDFISNYQSGNYKVVFSAQDSFGNLIKHSSTFKIKQSKDKFDTSRLFTVAQINSDARKDGFALIKLVSVIPDLYVIGIANFEGNIFSEETYHIVNHETVIKIPIKKEFKDIVTINFESVFENEKFDSSISVILKLEKPELKFDVGTFRSKLQPGSTENWSFKLTATATKKEAEVLASMYDTSLDQFATKNWEKWNSGSIVRGTSKSVLGSEKTSTILSNLNSASKKIELKNESTKLIWFGFDFNNTNYNTLYLQREYQRQLTKKVKKPLNAKLISGIVTDLANIPTPGVSVNVKDTQRTTVTDFDGYYEIEAKENEELVFSLIGFKSQSIKVAQDKTINFTLKEESNNLQEVVVTANGIKKEKKSLAYATTQVTSQSELVQEDNTVYNTAGSIETFDGKVAGISVSDYKVMIKGNGSISGTNPRMYVVDGIIVANVENVDPKDILAIDVLKNEKATALYGSKAANGVIIITTKKALEELTQVKARKNLSETAFFFPNLKTDSKGKVSFNFTSPEALTAWKLRLLAHNKDAVSGYLEKSVITQKELMVLPNFPRFFREKDTIVISAKISNVTAEAKTGIASLQFFDAVTMQPIDAKMLNAKNIKNFTIPAYGNTTTNWTITIPEGLQGIQYKIVAKAGNFSDGEENILPVLTNNILVTENIPIWVRENSTKEYTFENLKNNNSTTLKSHQFTLEYTSNPTWIAVQSLPYLMEYEHDCAEQTFARYYANALASEIISSNPKIAAVFENWKKSGKPISKLEENEELKALILAETPWLNDAQSEDEKKKNMALLFDLEKMKTSQETTFDKLKQKQKPSGAFGWFDGSDESEYITRHILAGLGHLKKLSKNNVSKIDEIAKTGIPFLDEKFLDYHKTRTKNLKATDKLIWINPYSDLHYLYTRSFYLEKYPFSDTLKKATKVYLETAKKDWLNYSIYEKGLAALTLNRFGEKESAKKIIENLKETSSNNEDWGMYWIANKSGWYWYQAPIETQALLIEAFAEITNDTKSVDAMKVWLLKNKQTKNWPTTKSTTEAIYALLIQGTDWLSVKDNTVIKLGDEKIITKKLAENEKEAETGYIKLNWQANEVKKEMTTIKIQNKSNVPAFGGAYWQYFEDLDKIKNNTGAVLSVSKELYLKKSTLKGDELQRITTKNPLKIGDLVTVRLVITSKEDTEYIHLKDMRASCFEPVNVLSQYQYKERLGYYMSTKDAATHFFFDQITKGTYVLEYDIRVNNSGEFSNGITTIQSMYVPEFASHTKGIRVKVN